MPNVGDLIKEVGYKNGYVYFTTADEFKNGNASIAARNSKDVILWSWHIWCSEEGWNDHVYPNNAGTMMDRNLGATSATPGDAGTCGLWYCWGRKDPFLGLSAPSSTNRAVSTGTWTTTNNRVDVDFAEKNPMTYVISGYDWVDSNFAGDLSRRWQQSYKTMYDPCPAGYRVPEYDFFREISSHKSSMVWDATNIGFKFILADGESTAWHPAISNSNGFGYYWSSTTGNNVGADTFGFYYNGASISVTSSSQSRSSLICIRCVREE
jgi:hypothetical protein